jgi:endonuclease III
MAVSAAGWPVTTPSELVAVRNDVWGKASTEEVTAAAAEETEESWATAAAAKAATEKKVEERIADCGLWVVVGVV